MVTPTELGLLAVVVALLVGVYSVFRVVKPLIVNTVVGLVVLFGAGLFGFGVQITPVVVLLVAFGGLPAAVVVLVLANLGYVFEPAMLLL